MASLWPRSEWSKAGLRLENREGPGLKVSTENWSDFWAKRWIFYIPKTLVSLTVWEGNRGRGA